RLQRPRPAAGPAAGPQAGAGARRTQRPHRPEPQARRADHQGNGGQVLFARPGVDLLAAARGGAGGRGRHSLSARPTAPAHARGRGGALPDPKFQAKEMAMSALTFANRSEAGRALAQALAHYRRAPGGLVLALPRGGVPVAYEVARTLALPMDVFIVRKIGHPRHPEYALGAVASGGVRTMNESLQSVPMQELDAVVARELQELARREWRYRGDRPLPALAGRTVI